MYVYVLVFSYFITATQNQHVRWPVASGPPHSIIECVCVYNLSPTLNWTAVQGACAHTHTHTHVCGVPIWKASQEDEIDSIVSRQLVCEHMRGDDWYTIWCNNYRPGIGGV